MSYTIVSDVCKGLAECVAVCPVSCIHWVKDKVNAKGTYYCIIDPTVCTACGVCLFVCPIADAVIDQWQPDLQRS